MHQPEDSSVSEKMQHLLDIIARLRSKGGCPWDRKQTLTSLKPFLIEEAYELHEVMDSDDKENHKDELGDVLLQVLLQARLREEEGAFRFDDVVANLTEKLIRRHPHVFSDVEAADADAVIRNWEAIKQKERKQKRATVLDGIPPSLPALHKAERVQTRAARVGFDWEKTQEVMAKVQEELLELQEAIAGKNQEQIQEETGDLLFSIVNLCRFTKVHAEDALNGTIEKFARRFYAVEKHLIKNGRNLPDCSLEEMDAAWNHIKTQKKG